MRRFVAINYREIFFKNGKQRSIRFWPGKWRNFSEQISRKNWTKVNGDRDTFKCVLFAEFSVHRLNQSGWHQNRIINEDDTAVSHSRAHCKSQPDDEWPNTFCSSSNEALLASVHHIAIRWPKRGAAYQNRKCISLFGGLHKLWITIKNYLSFHRRGSTNESSISITYSNLTSHPALFNFGFSCVWVCGRLRLHTDGGRWAALFDKWLSPL